MVFTVGGIETGIAWDYIFIYVFSPFCFLSDKNCLFFEGVKISNFQAENLLMSEIVANFEKL